ncbi:hypothetical protein CDAR_78431 [Caerostris darwini]|uniref:Uncharacterized protein n=1 Tax=Caerostris darwini TaxID=1538125 RepID=A0AAV4SDG0_9ARAC|nr:hypothetical protein CDAR_78431 [Caerostris darwini]
MKASRKQMVRLFIFARSDAASVAAAGGSGSFSFRDIATAVGVELPNVSYFSHSKMYSSSKSANSLSFSESRDHLGRPEFIHPT